MKRLLLLVFVLATGCHTLAEIQAHCESWADRRTGDLEGNRRVCYESYSVSRGTYKPLPEQERKRREAMRVGQEFEREIVWVNPSVPANQQSRALGVNRPGFTGGSIF